jgi:hypothetical protein
MIQAEHSAHGENEIMEAGKGRYRFGDLVVDGSSA